MAGEQHQSQNRQEYKNEFDTIMKMLHKFSDKQEEQGATLSDINLTLSQLNQTVVGNKTYGQKGLVEEVSDIKVYIEKKKYSKIKWQVGLLSLALFGLFY